MDQSLDYIIAAGNLRLAVFKIVGNLGLATGGWQLADFKISIVCENHQVY